MNTKKLIITISGPHGVGKSVYSRALARKFGLRLLSAGLIFRKMAQERGLSLEGFSKIAAEDESIDRQIDEYIVREARKGGVVVDSLLSGWMLKDIAHIRIYLKAPFSERVRRIAERDKKSFEEAYRETMIREKVEKERFKRYYNIDIEDLSVYNVVIDTTIGDIETIKNVLIRLVESYLKTH